MSKMVMGVIVMVVALVSSATLYSQDVLSYAINRPGENQKKSCTDAGGTPKYVSGDGYYCIGSILSARELDDGASCNSGTLVNLGGGQYGCDIGWSGNPPPAYHPDSTDTPSGGTNTGGGTTTGGGTSSGDDVERADLQEMQDPNAGCDGVKTNFFGECVSTEDGDGIYQILAVILNVLTFGIGIAATIGMVLAGLQYLTARDNAVQVEKAKMRILQIVIGLVMYAMIWALLQWLIPGGAFNFN